MALVFGVGHDAAASYETTLLSTDGGGCASVEISQAEGSLTRTRNFAARWSPYKSQSIMFPQ